MNKQIDFNTEVLLLKKFIEQNNNYFKIGLEKNDIRDIADQILARKYTNIQNTPNSKLKRQIENAESSRKRLSQPAASGSTGTVFGGPAGASYVGPLEEPMDDENNEVTSK